MFAGTRRVEIVRDGDGGAGGAGDGRRMRPSAASARLQSLHDPRWPRRFVCGIVYGRI